MNIQIGSAPDSWGVWFPSDPKQTPWQRFLDEIAEAGYEWTELGPYGYLPTDLPTLRAELDPPRAQGVRGVRDGPPRRPGRLARPRTAGARRRRAGGRPGRPVPGADRRHVFRPVHRAAHAADPAR